MPIIFKSPLSSTVANQTFLDKTIDDIKKGKLGLYKVTIGEPGEVEDVQQFLNELADVDGVAGEGDLTAKTYSSEEIIANGDDRKVAIGKLDAQAKLNKDSIDDLVSLSGVAINEPDLGVFTGTTIPDDSTIKGALQSVETAYEETDQNVNDLITLSGVAENSTNLGAFDHTIIADNETVKGALQDLEDGIKAINDDYGVANGLATLDGTGKVPSTQLPSYVDDVVEYANLAAFPPTGSSGLIYVALDTNKIYRWSGSTYVEVSPSSVASVNGYTDVVVLDNSDIGLGNVTNDAQLKRAANDFNSFTQKVTPVDNDIVLIEDSADSYSKKKVLLSDLGIGGGSGVGGINYIDNFSFEDDTDGVQPVSWNRYADAAATSPVDGTGGSPTITFLASITDPLRETKSAIISKTGSAQGQGVSYDFTIDSADKAQVLRLSFDYSSSALYADDNLRAYFYDITNAQLIEVVDRTISASAQGKYVGTFQTNSNSTSYRLILHVADSTSNNWTMKIDNVIVGPQTLIKGAIVTDQQEYVPTTQGFGTIGSNEVHWQRIGDCLRIWGSITVGTVTADEARVYFPSGYVISSSAYALTKIQGKWWRNNAGNPSTKGGTIITGTLNYFRFGLDRTDAAQAPNTAQSATNFINTGETLFFDVSGIPIQGWSSNLVLSEDSGNRLIRVRTAGNGSQAITANVTNITFTSLEDTTNSWNGSEFTAPESGEYKFIGCQSSTAGVARQIYAYIDTGSGYSQFKLVGSNVNQAVGNVHIGLSVYLIKGYKIAFRSTAGLTLDSSTVNSWLDITKDASPQTLSGSETVAARAVSGTGVSIPNTGAVTTVTYSSKSFDTHNAFTPSTGIFVAPQSGNFSIKFSLIFSIGTWTAGNYYEATFYKNSTAYSRTSYGMIQTTLSTNICLFGSDTIPLAKGDTLELRIGHSRTGGALAIFSGAAFEQYNYLVIEKVK